MSIVFDLERTNQLSLLPDKDLADFCPLIEPYQVTKNLKSSPAKIKNLPLGEEIRRQEEKKEVRKSHPSLGH
ncbi:hypothetical protein [Microcystis aeruginosa]|uniref:hypothetical protein n=1 Tax=Microcystis aeruginosa TaxID=1126 RepID=UPI000795F90C|nr:hypothetical protein [Microcystis aeruginosa]KXS89118.1 hypothetical protein OA58_23115 [Microcystis aeruginosa NIES-88]